MCKAIAKLYEANSSREVASKKGYGSLCPPIALSTQPANYVPHEA